MATTYKFEKFKNINFPVYCSVQKGTGTLVLPHFHAAAELIQITKGRVRAYINTKYIDCEAGDILYIPPLCVHKVDSTHPGTELQGFVFDFSLIPQSVACINPNTALSRDVVSRFLIDKQCAIHSSLAANLSAGLDIYTHNTATYELEMLSVICTLIALLLQHYCISPQEKDHFSRLQPVIDHIRDHYPQNISVSELSKIVHVCDDHLIRIFKAATNKTPTRYIMDLRLEEAMKLLVSTELSVTEIADQCGFSNSCYMDRLFKRHLHVTPMEYRRKR